ncbi:MAG: PilZ domain-containing protein [Emcibacteraceae bacterium]
MAIKEVNKILRTMRKHNRRAVVLPAKLDVDGQYHNCIAYDVSLGGIRLKVDAQIAANSQVNVRIKDTSSHSANVVWAAEGFVGLNFIESPNAIKAGLGGLASNLN